MTSRRLASAFAGLLVVIGVAPALAAAPSQTGWWWRPPVEGVPLPPPPLAEGELLVAGGPDGQHAVAALRAKVPRGADVVLRLQADNEVNGADAVVVACAATGWTPAAGGRWEDRPDADCNGAVPGTRNADGTAWRFEVGSLVRGDTLDVVLQPDPAQPAGRAGVGFAVVFAPPGDGSLTVTTASSPTTTSPPPPTTIPEPEPSVDTPGPTPPGTDSLFLAGAVGLAPTTLASVSEPTATGGEAFGPAQLRPAVTGDPPGWSRRILVFLMAAACVAAAVELGRRQRVQFEEAAGLGRFSRPRVGPPPSL